MSRDVEPTVVSPPGAASESPEVRAGTAQGPQGRAIGPLLVRIAAGLSAVALLFVAARLPIWVGRFSAPQYPDGLAVSAFGDKVEGDLGEIAELSHYIGMPAFNFVGMPEMRLWPLVIILAMVAAVLAVVTRRRWLRRLACTGIWLIPIGALADVQYRLWQTGHGLDPTAAIRVSPFTPRVVGPTTVMNFTINGYPGMALVLIAAAAALVTLSLVVAGRLTRSRAGSTGAEPKTS